MSKIPYFFDTPVPKYFRETGWFDNENTFKFVNWAFARCSTQAHKVVVDSKEITLAPFEFIAGRLTSPKECFLTEKQFRGQLNSLLDADLLKKGANSRANRFTTYIWVTERFCRIEGQQKGRLRANKGPTKGHNQEQRNKDCRYKFTDAASPSVTFSADKKKSVFPSVDTKKSAFKGNVKFSDEQLATFEWLQTLDGLDTSMDTLSWWARQYSLTRLDQVYHEAKKRKPKSLGAYMQRLLKKDAVVISGRVEVNAEFAKSFKDANSWINFEIHQKYGIIKHGNQTIEIEFNAEPVEFAKYLIQKYKTFEGREETG